MTTFDKRDQAYENKFAHDEEFRFKVLARRNKLLGFWAAEKMQLPAEDIEAYAKTVVLADFEAPGDEDVEVKVFDDLSKAGLPITREAVRAEMNRLLPVAQQQIAEQ